MTLLQASLRDCLSPVHLSGPAIVVFRMLVPFTRLSVPGLFLLMASVVPLSRGADLAPPTWQRVQWHGEDSLTSTSQGWKAIISLVRARLVHFGPADHEINLLFETADRANPAGWGGHRLWLGMQKDWASIWPPPAAWESSAAARVTERSGQLRLELSPVDDGWPDLVRTYQWHGDTLVCGAEFRGGSRPAQFISIFQVPRTAEILMRADPGLELPAGYVQLPSGAGPFARKFSETEHVQRSATADIVRLRHLGHIAKLGFEPQTIIAHVAGYTLSVGRGPETGERVGEPDEGFHSQVYLGRADEPFIELEQLTSLWAGGKNASASVLLSAKKR